MRACACVRVCARVKNAPAGAFCWLPIEKKFSEGSPGTCERHSEGASRLAIPAESTKQALNYPTTLNQL